MSTMRRVLVVLPLYGGSLPVGRFCCDGLRELGHLVEVFEAPSFHPAFTALRDLRVTPERLEQLENSFLNVMSQAVLAKVETFEPDLVLAMAQAPLSRQVLSRLRRDKVATAMWFVEDHRLFTYWQAFAPLYDLFAVIQREPFLAKLAAAGQANGLYLPLAAHPAFHRPLELSPAERREFGSDLSFLGAGYPNRRAAFRQLLGFDFKIWGNEWDGDQVLAPYNQQGGRRIAPEEAVKIFNASKINLNLHSSVQAQELVTGGDFVNPRTFEIAACGGFQLVDRRSLMGELFAEDELATFGSLEELKDLIAAYLRRPEDRAAYAARGRARVLRDHTYAQRMATLLDFAAARLPDWPRSRATEPGLDLPPDLAAELDTLLGRLGLPRSVGFKDLVWAIRQQQGTLTEVETAILFLDEWQKQYGGAGRKN
jgi:spore maturation protein CgeB